MNANWTFDEIVENYTLLSEEQKFVKANAAHNKLGKALLLKFFQSHARFPENRKEIHPQAVEYVAQQLGLSPEVFEAYKWYGRSIKNHRKAIREYLGFRPVTLADQGEMRDWLVQEILPSEISP